MGERIRATALGASEYSVQLSGNTGFISDPDVLLPRRSLQVVRPPLTLGAAIDVAEIAHAIRDHLASFDLEQVDADIVFALPWDGLPEYSRIIALAQGVRDALGEHIDGGRPLYLMLDGDIALTLGTLLSDELEVRTPILVIDGL